MTLNLHIITLAAYIAGIGGIWFASRRHYLSETFRIRKSTYWVFGAVSLFVYYSSPRDTQMIAELFQARGFRGIWMLIIEFMCAGFITFLFAPLWKKMSLDTDNKFILLRFSGIGSKVLYYFRAGYLGFLIVPILVSFQLLAFSRIISNFWDIPYFNAVLLAGGLLLASSVKNSLGITLRTDFFHGVLYLTAIGIIGWYLAKTTGHSLLSVAQKLELQKPGFTNIFPEPGHFREWNNLIVLLAVQWWSTSLFDGSGPEMQRFNSAGSPRKAMFIGLAAMVLSLMIAVLHTCLVLFAFSITIPGHQHELIPAIKYVIPDSLKMLVFIGLWSAFITTAEAGINWGASLVADDLGRHLPFVRKNGNNKHLLNLFIIVSLTVISVIFTILSSSLRQILELFLSFSAGVAPVFFLRWFWLRINAWSQLSAMVGSAVFTMIIKQFHPYPRMPFSTMLDPYYWQLVVVTLLTTVTWLSVTFMTPPDTEATLNRFRTIMPDRRILLRTLTISLLTGICLITAFLLIIKFLIA